MKTAREINAELAAYHHAVESNDDFLHESLKNTIKAHDAHVEAIAADEPASEKRIRQAVREGRAL